MLLALHGQGNLHIFYQTDSLSGKSYLETQRARLQTDAAPTAADACDAKPLLLNAEHCK